jgi:hypothetical protein
MFDGQVKVSGTVRELVFDDTVADIYLGPTLTARLRSRFSSNDGNGHEGGSNGGGVPKPVRPVGPTASTGHGGSEVQ